MKSFKRPGWANESSRHSLAAKGIKTGYFTKVTLYHGTPARNLPSIQKYGLKPDIRGEVYGTTSVETAKDYAQNRRRFTERDRIVLNELSKDDEFMEDFFRKRFNHYYEGDSYVEEWRKRIGTANMSYLNAEEIAVLRSMEDKYPSLKQVDGLEPAPGLVRFDVDDGGLKEEGLQILSPDSYVVTGDVPAEKIVVVEESEMLRKFHKNQHPPREELPKEMFAKKETAADYIKSNLESTHKESANERIHDFTSSVGEMLRHPGKDLDGEWEEYTGIAENKYYGKRGHPEKLSDDKVERMQQRGAALTGRVLSQANIEPLIDKREKDRTFRETMIDIEFGRRSE